MISKEKDQIKGRSGTRLIILGAGLVGAPMAMDLAGEPGLEVTVADVRYEALAGLKSVPAVQTVLRDLNEKGSLPDLLKEYDFVINALPGFLGFRALKEIIEAEKDVVDISFHPENPLDLHDLAVRKNVTAVVDCGVAPGMSNLLVGFADAALDRTDSVCIYVGGLPQIREWPFSYKAVFSVTDVLEEYIRPARFRQNGVVVTRPALTGSEFIDFSGIGTLEAFNTDGLRTLAHTIQAPDMIEKTLRYPGHIDKIRVLREAGFFSKKEMNVGGMNVRPFDVAASVLSRKWRMREGDRDLTVMRIHVEGEKDGRRVRYSYELMDRFDESTGIHSMARTTGYAATAAVRLLLSGLFSRKGISPPEFIGRHPDCVNFMLAELEKRGLYFSRKSEEVNIAGSE
jgi:lysine 6-dehydrogenase